MKTERVIPLSVSQDRFNYNLDVLQENIQEMYQDGINTQLNRRRVEGDNAGRFQRIDLQDKRLYRLGKLVFDAAVS